MVVERFVLVRFVYFLLAIIFTSKLNSWGVFFTLERLINGLLDSPSRFYVCRHVRSKNVGATLRRPRERERERALCIPRRLHLQLQLQLLLQFRSSFGYSRITIYFLRTKRNWNKKINEASSAPCSGPRIPRKIPRSPSVLDTEQRDHTLGTVQDT